MDRELPPGWRMGALMILVGALLAALGVYRVADAGEVTAWRVVSIGAALFAIVLGVRLVMPDRMAN